MNFTPENGSTLHVGVVGENRIGTLYTIAQISADTDPAIDSNDDHEGLGRIWRRAFIARGLAASMHTVLSCSQIT